MASNSKNIGELLNTDDNIDRTELDFISSDGTGAVDLPNGTTAQRPTAASGMLRFNSTLNLAEYYDGTQWKAIDSPPTVTSISPETFTASGTTITITGQNFQSGINVKLIDTDGTELTPDSVTLVSASSITFDTTQAMVDNENDKFDVKVTNTSGLSGTLDNVLEISDGTFSFTNAATSTLYDSARSSGFDAGGTLSGGGGESDVTISYAVTSGSLPSGGSISSSTGSVTGISAVGSDTVSNFTVTTTVSDTSEGTSDTYTRAFALTVKAPVVTSYTSVGSGTFSVPTGLQTMNVLVVAGGGSGGSGDYSCGGGGAGGLIYRPAFPVTPGGSISYTVGDGGTGSSTNGAKGNNGQNSTWGTLVTQGGGAGGGYDPGNNGGGPGNGSPGGSGGGGGNSPGQSTGNPGSNPNTNPTGQGWVYQGGPASQPSQPGDSGTYGFGNPGGTGGHDTGDWEGGGGGGGAAQAGANGGPSAPRGGPGGNGKSYSISGSSVTYAGGGGAGGNNGGNGGQGGGGAGTNSSGAVGQAGSSNTGGGAGGGYYSPGVTGAKGGSGIIIVSY